jgi:hypothetical protein
MKRYVEGEDGSQSTLFPERLGDTSFEDNPGDAAQPRVDVADRQTDAGGWTLDADRQ